MRYSCSSLNPYFFPGASVAVLLPPVMNVTDGPAVGVVVALHPVVMVSVMVGMTHPVAHVGQAVVVYFVGVTGQQFVLGTCVSSWFPYQAVKKKHKQRTATQEATLKG